MDFTFSSEAEDAAALAATILADHESGDTRFDATLWRTLQTAFDGADLGFVELCRVLVEAGRTVAPVPWAADAVARFVLAEQNLPVPPHDVLTCATAEEHDHAPSVPTTTATPDDDGHVLTGTKYLVPAATRAGAFLVPARTPDGTAVFLIDADSPRLTIREQHLSDGDVVGLVELDEVRTGGPLDVSPARLLDLLTVATCAVQLGVTEGAVALTADYATTRQQFDRPIATFQAVSQRLADGYIDTRFQALTLWQAAWRLAERLPAEEAIASAKLWAADAGHRIAHTTVHVHGGVGVDLDSEAHRYFTAAKRFEFEHGGTTVQALRIGRLLADGPA